MCTAADEGCRYAARADAIFRSSRFLGPFFHLLSPLLPRVTPYPASFPAVAFASASKSRMCVHSYSSCSVVEFTGLVLLPSISLSTSLPPYLFSFLSLARFLESRRFATKLSVFAGDQNIFLPPFGTIRYKRAIRGGERRKERGTSVIGRIGEIDGVQVMRKSDDDVT